MNTFIYIILALVAVCIVCTVIVMVKVFSRQETTSDVSSKDFDRLEGEISEEKRSAWQELSDIIDKLLQGLSRQTPRRLSVSGYPRQPRSIATPQSDNQNQQITVVSELYRSCIGVVSELIGV